VGLWHLLALVHCDLGSGKTMTLTGGGSSATTWEGPSTVGDQPGIEVCELNGFSNGGDQPTITLTFPNGSPTGAYNGILSMWCVRVA
jgi:hypothetical protein